MNIRSAIREKSIFLMFGLMLFSVAAQAADPVEGKKIYKLHCQTCHGAKGAGEMPGMPDFSRGDALFTADYLLVSTIEQGRGVMPAFRGLLATHEILDVISYLRTLR